MFLLYINMEAHRIRFITYLARGGG